MEKCNICGLICEANVCDTCIKMNEIDEFWNSYEFQVYKREEKERYADIPYIPGQV